MSAGWLPTHVVPDAGLPTHSAPDVAGPDNALPGGLEVEVVATRDAWAEVRCSNGWSAWVELRRLMPLEHSARDAPPAGAPEPRGDASGEGFFEQLARPGNDLLAGAAALIASAIVSYVLWSVLAIPGLVLRDLIPRGDCTNEVPGSAGMYRCSVRAGAMTAVGPLAVVVLAMVFRRPIAAQVSKLTSRLPKGCAILVTPLLATAFFTMMYAAVHDKTSDQSGLVPQRMFPAVVGLFTFAAGRAGPAVTRRFGAAIARRDRVPKAVRLVAALAVPMLISYLLTNQDRVSDTALKEQVVALLTLVTTYAALVPRDGDFLGASQRFVASRTERGIAGGGVRR